MKAGTDLTAVRMVPIGHAWILLAAAFLLAAGAAESDAAQLAGTLHPESDIILISSHVSAENGTSAGMAPDGIHASGIFFENASIMEFTNNSGTPVTSFTFWLAAGQSFESFKTESGWTGKKTPHGTIEFTTAGMLETGESVKFGVRTSEANPGINWNAIDAGGNQIDIGRTVSESVDLPGPATEPDPDVGAEPDPDPVIEQPKSGVLADSAFRVIPEKPKVGSTIRVTGEKFGADQQFDLYMDAQKLGTFRSDSSGNFVTTAEIPGGQAADRISLRVVDSEGSEKTFSIRLGDADHILPAGDIMLGVHDTPSTLHRGDALDVTGTVRPGSTITASVRDSGGSLITTITAKSDTGGDWMLPEPILIPLDAEFDTYSMEISDGRESKTRTWQVASSKVIVMEPSKTIFEPGETMSFNGTARPNTVIEFILEDPLEKEIYSETYETDNAGSVKFEYTTQFSSHEGTYTLIATQGDDKEFVFAGLGQRPIIPINLKFDKLNYKSNETAIISLVGSPSDTVELEIIDPSDKVRPEIKITLGPDGVGRHHLDLSEYRSGIYTAVIGSGSSESTETFTVGLKASIGEITINAANPPYHPGDSIIILGETDPNSLLKITLLDPNGTEIKTKNYFSGKDGKITESTFKIPADAESGQWTITARSGSHFDDAPVNVTTMQQGMIILVNDKGEASGMQIIEIEVLGAAKFQTVSIVITSPTGETTEFESRATKDGEIRLIMKRPAEPGSYTISAKDVTQNAELTYLVG